MSEFRTDVSLRDATIQEIQWELIRRTQHNALDGEEVAQFLEQHRELWTAAIIDCHMVWNLEYRLPMLGLLKLRDLPQDFWNVDTLYLMTESRENAQ